MIVAEEKQEVLEFYKLKEKRLKEIREKSKISFFSKKSMIASLASALVSPFTQAKLVLQLNKLAGLEHRNYAHLTDFTIFSNLRQKFGFFSLWKLAPLNFVDSFLAYMGNSLFIAFVYPKIRFDRNGSNLDLILRFCKAYF